MTSPLWHASDTFFFTPVLFVQVQRQGTCILAASSGAGPAMTASSIVEEFYAVQQPATYNIRYSEALKVQAGAVSDSIVPEQDASLYIRVAQQRQARPFESLMSVSRSCCVMQHMSNQEQLLIDQQSDQMSF